MSPLRALIGGGKRKLNRLTSSEEEKEKQQSKEKGEQKNLREGDRPQRDRARIHQSAFIASVTTRKVSTRSQHWAVARERWGLLWAAGCFSLSVWNVRVLTQSMENNPLFICLLCFVVQLQFSCRLGFSLCGKQSINLTLHRNGSNSFDGKSCQLWICYPKC